MGGVGQGRAVLVPGGGDGEAAARPVHAVHQPRRVPRVRDTGVLPTLELQSHLSASPCGGCVFCSSMVLYSEDFSPESIVETPRPTVVEASVDCSNINPGVEAVRLPDLFPLALVVQTQAEVPVRPRDARDQPRVRARLLLRTRGRGHEDEAVLPADGLQPLAEQHETRGQGHAVIHLLLADARQLPTIKRKVKLH